MMYNKFIKFKAGLVELADTLGLELSGAIRGSSNFTNKIFLKKDLTSFENDDIILLSSDGGVGRHTGFKHLRPLT